MPFCAAAAIVLGHVGIDTFTPRALQNPAILALQSRVNMRVDPGLDAGAPALTRSRVAVRLHDGRVLCADANGARGYPDRPASDDELAAKFVACATSALPDDQARAALESLRDIDTCEDVRQVTRLLQPR
jgi:2-methylcitrate dehydratase PrpD